MKDREYIGNVGRGATGTSRALNKCYTLGADTCVTIQTLNYEKVAMGATWHCCRLTGLSWKL
jgi:hypothetical protein